MAAIGNSGTAMAATISMDHPYSDVWGLPVHSSSHSIATHGSRTIAPVYATPSDPLGPGFRWHSTDSTSHDGWYLAGRGCTIRPIALAANYGNTQHVSSDDSATPVVQGVLSKSRISLN